MAQKQHTKSRTKPKRFEKSLGEEFIQSELEESLIELVNADTWPRSFIALGRIKTLSKLIDLAQINGNKYQQLISVTFRRLR